MPLLTIPSERNMRAEYHALVTSARARLNHPHELRVEDLALAADDLTRAAALAGVLTYLEAVNPFPRDLEGPSDGG